MGLWILSVSPLPSKELPWILSGGWYYSHARDLQDGITACCPISKNLSKLVGCCWVQRTMNNPFLVVEVPRRQHTEWQVTSWTSVSEHVHPQLLASCLAVGTKFCSLRRGACASCILLQFQRPQVLLLQLPQHYLLQTGKISLPDVLSPAQRRRAARCWHCGSQGTGSSGGKGTVEGGTVSHWVPGVLQSWMENVWADECMNACGCKGCRGDVADDVLCKTLGHLLCARQL